MREFAMQVSVENSGEIERKITVSVAAAEVERDIAKRLAQLSSRARIRGFRPGKAPLDVVKQKYGAQVTQEVVGQTIQASYQKALEEQKIAPAGLVSIDPQPFVAGGDLRYTATIELFPKVACTSLAGRTVEQVDCELTQDDISKSLQQLRKHHADFVPKHGAAQKGDRVCIDYRGSIDGKPFNAGSAESHYLILGEETLLPEFDAGLVGAKKDTQKEIQVAFAEDYAGSEVAGKTAKFAVTVNSVDTVVLPELDQQFAQKMGIAQGGVAKLRARLKASMQSEVDARLQQLQRTSVLDALLAVNPIKVPQRLVDTEIDYMVQSVTQRMTQQGLPAPKQKDIERAHFSADAERKVRLGLIMREVVKTHAIKPDPAAVQSRLTQMAAAVGDENGAKMIAWYNQEPSRLRSIEAMLTEELAVEKLRASAQTKQNKVSFAELMRMTS